LGGSDAKGIGVREAMCAFDFRGGTHQRLIDRVKVDRELFEQAKSFGRFGGPDAAFENIEEFAPIDPVERCASPSFFLGVKGFLHDLPARLAVKETDKGKAIENELFAHDAPLPGVLEGDLGSGKIGPLGIRLPLRWDRQGRA
jgi:hypothetical protein